VADHTNTHHSYYRIHVYCDRSTEQWGRHDSPCHGCRRPGRAQSYADAERSNPHAPSGNQHVHAAVNSSADSGRPLGAAHLYTPPAAATLDTWRTAGRLLNGKWLLSLVHPGSWPLGCLPAVRGSRLAAARVICGRRPKSLSAGDHLQRTGVPPLSTCNCPPYFALIPFSCHHMLLCTRALLPESSSRPAPWASQAGHTASRRRLSRSSRQDQTSGSDL